jgi:hypothetical protein
MFGIPAPRLAKFPNVPVPAAPVPELVCAPIPGKRGKLNGLVFVAAFVLAVEDVDDAFDADAVVDEVLEELVAALGAGRGFADPFTKKMVSFS